MTDNSDELVAQNDLIISLLGRVALKNDELKELVLKGSKKPKEVLEAYNLCDGKTTVSNIAKQSKLNQGSLSVAVDKWVELGIAYKRVKGNEVYPKKLFTIQ